MGAKTKIEWCDSTINPTSGCDGCELYNPSHPEDATCYARGVHENRLARFNWRNYGAKFSEVRMIAGRMEQAAGWSDLRGKPREAKPWLDLLPRCIFVGDLGDVLSRDVSDEFIERELFAQMESAAGSRHFWMLLTKRPRRLADLSIARGGLPANCMAMTTVTDQATANVRLPHLLRCQARWRGVSAEPLFGAVRLHSFLNDRSKWIDLVIAGGESGPGSRATDVSSIRGLVAECRNHRVPVFVKQLGALAIESDAVGVRRLGLRHKKGGDWSEWPGEFCVREFPDVQLEMKEVLA